MLFTLEFLGLAHLGRTGLVFLFLIVATVLLLFLLLRLMPWVQSLPDPGLWFSQALAGLLLVVLALAWVQPEQQLLVILASLPWIALHGLVLGSLRSGLLVVLLGLAYILFRFHGGEAGEAAPAWQVLLESLGLLLAAGALLIAVVAFELKGQRRSGGNLRRDLSSASQPRLLGRDELLEVLAREVARSRRKKTPFSIAMMDLDELNRLHLEQGQGAVDVLHQGFAKCLLERARQMDIVGRRQPGDEGFGQYQGRDFIAVLPATPIRGAISFANRIRQAMNGQVFPYRGGKLKASVSAGVSEYREGESLEALICRAESALRRAQRLGRDRVQRETAGDSAASSN